MLIHTAAAYPNGACLAPPAHQQPNPNPAANAALSFRRPTLFEAQERSVLAADLSVSFELHVVSRRNDSGLGPRADLDPRIAAHVQKFHPSHPLTLG